MQFVRPSLVLAASLTLFACGSGAAGGGPICTLGQESSPGAVDDPCPQQGTDCANAGGSAFALCTEEGVWAAECTCRLAGGSSGTAVCGNGVREGSEQCDTSDLGGGTCAMSNGAGTLLCDPATCTYDFSMCTNTGVGGSGGG
jgi:hypothetical protein